MFTDLEKFLDENLGYRTRELEQVIELNKRAASVAAFREYSKKWRKENPEAFRAYQKWWYHKKRKDPVWWAHRQASNRAYKQRMKKDARFKMLRRAQARRYVEKIKTDPVRYAQWQAKNREKLRKKRALKRAKLFKKAA